MLDFMRFILWNFVTYWTNFLPMASNWWPINSIYPIVKATSVTQIVACSITPPERGHAGGAVNALFYVSSHGVVWRIEIMHHMSYKGQLPIVVRKLRNINERITIFWMLYRYLCWLLTHMSNSLYKTMDLIHIHLYRSF